MSFYTVLRRGGISNGAKAKFQNVSTKRLFQSFFKQGQTDWLDTHTAVSQDVFQRHAEALGHILRQNLKNK